jgi:hypothetical protein
MIPVAAPVADAGGGPQLRQRFWWLNRLVAVGFGILAVLAGSWLWLDRHEARLLADEIARWRAAGLAIEAGDFYEPSIPDDQNAAVALGRACQLYVRVKEYDDAWEELESTPLSAHAQELVERALNQNRAALDSVRAARALPRVRWEPTIDVRDLLTPMAALLKINNSVLRSLANLLKGAARSAHARGDDEAYLDCVLDIRFLARASAEDSLTLSALVAWGMDSLGSQLVQQDAHELNLASARARREARELIDESLSLGDASAGSRRARAVMHNAAWWLQAQRRDRPPPSYRYMEDRWTEPSRWQVVQWRAFRPQRYHLTRRVLERYRQDSAVVSGASWPAIKASLVGRRVPHAPKSGAEPADSLLEQVIDDTASDNARLVQTCFGTQTSGAFAAVSLAARMYSIDHGGTNPPTLTALVPDYLPRVPPDPFDPANGSLRYVGPGRTPRPFTYSLFTAGTDLVASGRFVPLLSQHLDWRSANLVSFLDPTPPMPPAAASTVAPSSATQPSPSTQRGSQ